MDDNSKITELSARLEEVADELECRIDDTPDPTEQERLSFVVSNARQALASAAA